MQTIRHWLEDLGLEQYADAFERNDIGVDILTELNGDDLQRLGVSLGHSKRILRALKNAGAPPQPVESAGMSATAPIETITAGGERRQVTVLFCDLVGSTRLSNTLDPEHYRAVLVRYHETCVQAIARFEGYVAQIQGDGIVAYFGYPLAHESEAERAVRAALHIVERLTQLDSGLDQVLRVRIGIATGLVVVSHVLATEKSAIGETPNLAYRLQALANPGEIFLSDRSKELAGGSFEFQDCGEHALKGIAGRTHVYRVRGISDAATRFDAATRGRLTPMVGREQEIGLLLDRWSRSRTGEGQVVLLQGEPGIGKSRMLRAFQEQLGDQLDISLHYQCSPYYTSSVFYPIVDHLERALEFAREDSTDQKLDKLERYMVEQLGFDQTQCSLLARTLSIPCDSRYGPLEVTPQRQKDDTIALLVDMVIELSKSKSVAMLFEDLHWADPSSIEVLSALIDRMEEQRLLVLLTYRPEFQPPWLSRSHVTPIVLTRLSRAQGAIIARRVARNKSLPAELTAQIVDKTDGVPLFIEELTKAVLESDMLIDAGDHYDFARSVDKLTIPNTLRDSLMARLDRLIPVKEIAQIGACLGREFSYELVRAVSPMQESQFDEALEKLTASELVYRRGKPPNATYIFKHALVQDAAYDSLLKSKRQELHAQIAKAILQYSPDSDVAEPELLAHHYSEAGMLAEAVDYWRRAGELAQERVALNEAIRHYQRGLDTTLQLEPGDRRDANELTLRALLGIAWIELYGYAHPEVTGTLKPALKLIETVNVPEYTMRVLWGLWVDTLCTGRIEESVSWAERLLETAEKTNNEHMRLVGHWAACDSFFFLGKFEESIRHADAILDRYDPERDRDVAKLVNHDPKTIALAYKAVAQWTLGFPTSATRTGEAAIAHSRLGTHKFDICWVQGFLAQSLYSYSCNINAADIALNDMERIAADQKLLFFSEMYVPLGRALWLHCCNQHEEAEAKMQNVLPVWKGAGLAIYVPYMSSVLAESMLELGKIESAFDLLSEALDQIERPGWREVCAHAEVLRVKACAHACAGQADIAESVFVDALQVARRQAAKSWELRTATHYARLLLAQGRPGEAMLLLQPVYDWFTEGHETRDLQQAAALLSDLREVHSGTATSA